jgi:hypothetical protein
MIRWVDVEAPRENGLLYRRADAFSGSRGGRAHGPIWIYENAASWTAPAEPSTPPTPH